MGQPVARNQQTDTVATNHMCDGTTTTDTGSSNVRVNGKGFVRAGDTDTVHDFPSGDDCLPHVRSLTSYSSTVRVNGRGIGRIGDAYSGEVIVTGSGNVTAGG